MNNQNNRQQYEPYFLLDLGCTYTASKSFFKVWAPSASKVHLCIYEKGIGDNLLLRINMKLEEKGVWHSELNRDLLGLFYVYEVQVGEYTTEAVDWYATAVGVNGKRGMIIDLNQTNPKGWEEDAGPIMQHNTDYIIYEMHIRDFSIDSSSNIQNKGKFIGVVEKGTKNDKGLATGLEHLIELGITHVHLLPSFDYGSIDEEKLDQPQFNWGYDPLNYNCPEGSYATDPYDGTVRIREVKEMIQKLHEEGIGVILERWYELN